jgi:hypothetical protein
MVFKCLAAVVCLTALAGVGVGQDEEGSPDERVKALIAKYHALPDRAKVGPEGANLVKQLKAVAARGKLSARSQGAVARLEASHNLRQLALALERHDGKEVKPPAGGPGWFPLLPYLEQKAARPRWEYKVLSEGDISRLGKDGLTTGLNKLGEDGWELVGFEKTRFIFKRRMAALLGRDW